MFEKLLANLPYNPKLTKQVNFFARRLRHEESVRRTGMVFLALAFLIQLVAFISPPQSAADGMNSQTATASICQTQGCVTKHISAANVTTGADDANDTTAQSNEVIAYTLFATNQGNTDVTNFVMQEKIHDVLDYADIVDLHGGTKSTDNVVSWPAATIKPGVTLTHKVTVRVKDQISSKTAPASDPQHFDYAMTSSYGNLVGVKVPMPPGVAPLVAASSSGLLARTSPGEGLMLAVAVLIIGAYFFARARLLVDESMIVMQETSTGSMKP